METITLKLFTLSELNPEAKEKALNYLTEEAAENVMLCKDLKSTLEDVIEAGIDNLCKSIQSEYEYQTSEEGIIEYLDETDRKFLEDGREF